MIDIRGLTVAFGAVTVIDGLDAVLEAPVCGLIGPNGAGKTTLVNVLSGFVRAKAGEVCIAGTSLLGLDTARRVRLGLRRSFQTEQVVEDLSTWDNVQAMLDHVPHALGDAQRQVHRALEHTGLLDCAATLGVSWTSSGAAWSKWRRRWWASPDSFSSTSQARDWTSANRACFAMR